MGFSKSPEEAEKNALSSCKENASKCKAVSAAWDQGAKYFALAQGDNYSHFTYGYDSDVAAKRDAIAACEKAVATVGSCKVGEDWSGWGEWWYAFAKGNSMSGIALDKTKTGAIERAISECMKVNAQGDTCKVSSVTQNPPLTDAPASFKRLKARIAAATQAVSKPSSPSVSNDCRPKSDYLRCTSQCINGSCVVTYENGCKMQVQVRPKFNPLNSQWEYPSPGC